MRLTRSAKVTFTILEGQDILDTGHETARHLWNFTRHCAVSYNWKIRRQRNHWPWDVYKHLMPKYPGKFEMQKILKDFWAAQELSDRCFSYTIKEFDIAMRSWFSNLKTNPKARPPRYIEKPRQLTFEAGRNAKPLGDWMCRLTVLGGHIPDRHAIVKVHIQPGIKMKDIKLIRIRPDRTGTVVYYTQQTEQPGDGITGIDLGIINLACVAFQDGDSILYSGKAILDSDRYYQKRAAKCKPSGWNGNGHQQSRQSKRNKSYRRKAGNSRNLAIHNVTRNIIDECVRRNIGTIVIGDLKGIRYNKDFGKAGNQKLYAWAFAEVLRQIQYKAEEVDIEVILVNERNTSKTCHVCGIIGKRVERGNFICPDCQIEINADVNGAFNILNKVSPAPAYAGVGVGGVLPAPPSLAEPAQGTGKVRLVQISPTFIVKLDLRNWSIVQTRCDRLKTE